MSSLQTDFRFVGRPVTRREGAGKLTGRARYVDDIATPGALTAKTLRSGIAAGRIREVHFADGIPWHEFVIADARDLQRNVVALIAEDQPAFCDRIVRHHEEPILVIAHEDPGLVTEAIRAIRVEYDEEP